MATQLVRFKHHHGAGAPNALFRRILSAIPALNAEMRPSATAGVTSRILEEFLTGAVKPAEDGAAAAPEDQTLACDGLNRTLGAALALLRYAHVMLERLEKDAAAQAARIAQLEMLATTDDLTGLKNRRGFLERFLADLDLCERGLSDGGLLVLIDLDNFKAINDTYGHPAGDACLRLVGATLAEDVRLMDTAARFGGDEFVLLLSSTTRKKAAGRAQQLAWRLNNLSLAWQGEIIPVRASIGLKEYAKGDTPEGIFRAADDDLYDDKNARREEAEGLSAAAFVQRMLAEDRPQPRRQDRAGVAAPEERILIEF